MSEGAPTPLIFETSSAAGAQNATSPIQMLNMPPLRRTILRTSDGRRVMQLQQDRLVLNWPRGQASAYRDFRSALQEFEAKADLLFQSLREENIGQASTNQYELVYVNLIGPENGLSLVPETALLIDHTRQDGTRFLPPPVGFNWSSTHELPDRMGRLHIIAQAVLVPPANNRHVRLDLVARSFTPLAAGIARAQWFELAHEWITRGFADSTADVLQTHSWRRR
jgi:uncharacterized protein (TIGR04255 family)